MTIQSFFGGMYYINLDRRPDIDKQARQQFSQLGLRPQRISGFDMKDVPGEFDTNGPKGHLGCRISHNIAVTLARFQHWDSVLIFEDDVLFVPQFVEKWNKVEPDIPDDWDVLYLSCRAAPENYTHIKGSVYRVKDAVLGHAYAIRQKAYEAYGVRMATTLKNQDNALGSIEGLNVYAIKPTLVHQSAHFSETDYRDQRSVGM